MTKTKTNNNVDVQTTKKKSTRNATLEIARFIMALLIFCTHLDQLEAIHNTFLAGFIRAAGEISLGGFALITGYFMVRTPGRYRALTSLMIFIILLLIGWIFDAIVVGSTGHIWAGPSASHFYTTKTFFEWKTTLFIMFFGTAIHWYMWQIFIVMLIFPILAYGLQKLSKNRYLFTVILLLSIDVVSRMIFMVSGTSNGASFNGDGSAENGLGLFAYPPGQFGGWNSVMYGGFSWMFLITLAIAGGYMQLHAVKGNIKRAWILVIPLALAILQGTVIQVNASLNYNYAQNFAWNINEVHNTNFSYWSNIIQGEKYGINWWGFFANAGYLSPIQLISMITMFYGLIQLPKLKSKVGLYLGSLGFALYVVHVATMSLSIDLVHFMNNSWAQQLTNTSKKVAWVSGRNGVYVLVILFSWILTLPIAIGAKYITRYLGRLWLKLTHVVKNNVKFFREM